MECTRVTADTLVKSGQGKLHTISIAPTTATPTAGLLSVYDALTASGKIVYSEWVFATTPGHTITLDCDIRIGIHVEYDATLANASCTVTFQ
jgi:hypothetical protein